MSNAALEVSGVTVEFGSVVAVDDVSFAGAEGAILGILGPNGAGKSTLFNVVTGHLRPQRGEVTFGGRRITGMAPHRIARLGLVRTFQSPRAFPNMTVRENLMAGGHLLGRSGLIGAALGTRRSTGEERLLRAHTAEILASLGIGELAGAMPAELTAGQLRLCEIGRALATGARCLLLDEPAAGLSVAESLQLSDLLATLRSNGFTLVLVEHDVELVLGISDAVCVLDFGVLIAHGTAAEIRSDANVLRAYLGEPGKEEVA